MEQNAKVKIFISYSHLDETQKNEFIKHTAPLRNNGLIQVWHDRKIIAGQDFQNTIDNNLDNADIICLLISANFLNSYACLREKAKAYELNKKKGISVVAIILSECGWLDDNDISKALALPKDGKPVSSFDSLDKAWHEVYQGIKVVIDEINKISNLTINNLFMEFLENTELLSRAHSQKENIILDDIFIFPALYRYDDLGEYEKKESAENLIEDFGKYKKIVIVGEGQSGKTTLCKKFFIELRRKRLVPVYIALNKEVQGSIDSLLIQSFKNQYQNLSLRDIDLNRLVPIVDNLHQTKYKERYIQELAHYTHQIIIVDDIFRMNFKDEKIIDSFSKYKIKEFSPYQRYELIKKWAYLSDKKIDYNDNSLYKIIDQKTELVNNALGKVLGRGIMPAYPFFILSVISTYETFQIPLDQEITSQGYCYQALIFLYLRKQGVKNDEIDTYFNFLTEFAFQLFVEKRNELSIDEFNSFMVLYLKKFNLPMSKETLLNRLERGKILYLDSCNNYSFFYPYIYYYFVAKYLAEHCEVKKEIIDKIINNLHINENAYIAVFMSHHSRNAYVLDEIILNALTLFDEYTSATLSKDELKFFDDQVDMIIKEVLPIGFTSPEIERKKRLELEESDEFIEEKEEDTGNENIEEDGSEDLSIFSKDLRRAIKTVEVMGQIIKNRAGSLEKDKLKMVFEEAMKIHLKVLSSFFELIKGNHGQEVIINYISKRLELVVEEMDRKPNKDKLEKISRIIFWNTNFEVVFSHIAKIIKSLGSEKLINIVEEVCDNINTPAAFVVKHGIFMWYNKNLQIDNISNKITESGFSEISKKILRFIIVDYASMHVINYKEKQKIETKIGIPSKNLLIENIKKGKE